MRKAIGWALAGTLAGALMAYTVPTAFGSDDAAFKRDKDRSRDDLTKDRTRDGKGPSKRDWSQNRTYDRSRNDTR